MKAGPAIDMNDEGPVRPEIKKVKEVGPEGEEEAEEKGG